MQPKIEAVFFDLGHTLRIVLADSEYQAGARREIARLLGSEEDPATLFKTLEDRYEHYRKWALETMVEAPEFDLWNKWLTPEIPPGKIAPVSADLTYQFRQALGRRVLVDGGREVVDELHQRGFILGIISNLIGTREIPEWLEADGLNPYFKSVVLSSVYGKRKPDPAVYYEAARRAGVDPAKCAYVGDNLKRDVTGTRDAGFGMIIIMTSPEKLAQAEISETNRPDIIIHNIRELLEIFSSPQ